MDRLTEADVATLLGCTPRHVRRLRTEGKLRTDRIEGEQRYIRTDVVDYMEKRLSKDQFIPAKKAAHRANIPPTTIYSAVENYRIRHKTITKGRTRIEVYWPDCDELYVQCVIETHSLNNSPDLEQLFGVGEKE